MKVNVDIITMILYAVQLYRINLIFQNKYLVLILLINVTAMRDTTLMCWPFVQLLTVEWQGSLMKLQVFKV